MLERDDRNSFAYKRVGHVRQSSVEDDCLARTLKHDRVIYHVECTTVEITKKEAKRRTNIIFVSVRLGLRIYVYL